MYLFENKISLEERDKLQPYLDGFPYETSGLAFSSMYMWRNCNDFCWQKIGDYMCIEGISHLELEEGILLHFMFPPLTRDGNYDPAALRKTIFEAKRIFEDAGQPFSLRLVPPALKEIISRAVPEIEWMADRPNYDYVYSVPELIELKGRKFHGKKNHLNYFKKTYQYEYERMTPDMTDEIMVFIQAFNRRKQLPANEMEMLIYEEKAMEDVFRNLDVIGLYGGVIRIDGNIEALAVGGRLGEDIVVEHIEKANVNFRGLYPAINNEFCKSVSSWASYINREEDMDYENLRKAKLSYQPIKLLEKYIGVIK